MSESRDARPSWRRAVDLGSAEVALTELRPLLESVAATGSTLLIKVDGERSQGTNPPIFTVVISGGQVGDGAIRFDDSDLVRAFTHAVEVLDRRC